MSTKKTFVGYDLGDGETITDLTTLEETQIKGLAAADLKPMTMPDSNVPGQAIPTAFGYTKDGELVFASSILMDAENIENIHASFKRRPSDLMGHLSKTRKTQIEALFKNGKWPSQADCPEVYTPDMEQFSHSVRTFTDAIFSAPAYRKSIRDEAVDSDEIVFCVGHPTRWNSLDVAVYAAILRGSILGKGAYEGKPSTFIMAAESRAAFLYVREKTDASVLPRGTCALLIDIGSSTIDLTAMTADSRNHQYNSGSNYLGARSIDYMIRNWYIYNLRQNSEDWTVFQNLIRLNPTLDQALTLSCRKAKEEVFSIKAAKSRVIFCDFPPVSLTLNTLNHLVNTVPIGPLLQENAALPASEAAAMGDETWKPLFREFLLNSKAEMTAQKLKLGRAIITGSASKMPFVEEIIREVFQEISQDNVLSDLNPSRSISKGLALVGASNEKSKQFQEDLERMMETELPQVIEKDIPALADGISKVLDEIVGGVIRKNMLSWRAGGYRTLDDMMYAIKDACSEKKLNALLTGSADYQAAVSNWMTQVVGQDIAVKLQALCQQYGVSDFTLDSLNVMKVPSINVGGLKIDPTRDMMDALGNLVMLIGGVIAAVILPTVLGVITGILMLISFNVGFALFTLLMAIPGPGYILLAGIAGVSVAVLLKKGIQGLKDTVTERIQGWDLPEFARKLMTDKKIDKEIEKAGLREKIKQSIMEKDSAQRITSSVLDSLRSQIEKRAEDIKYVIESR